jgi:predicted MFS family arabinose efflux permease
MFGLANAINNFTCLFLSVFVGATMMYTWKVSFYSFGFIFIVAIFALVGIPSAPPLKDTIETEANKEKVKLNRKHYGYAVLMCCIMILMLVSVTTGALFMGSEISSEGALIGVALALPGSFVGVAGVLFPYTRRLLGKIFEPICLLGFALGYVLLYTSHTVPVYFIGLIVIGLFQGHLVPQLFAMTASASHSNAQKDMALSFTSAFMYLGFVLSAYYQSLVLMFKPDSFTSSYRYIYLCSIIIILISCTISFIVKLSKKEQIENEAV